MSEPLIDRLRKLQHQRGDASPFATHTEFQTWSDSVLPLLAFDPTLQNQFKSAVHAAYVNLVQKVQEGVLSNINRAIGIVNQAVVSLEIVPEPSAAQQPPNEIKPNGIENQHGLNLWQRPLGLVWVAVAGGTLVLMIGYIFRHYLGIPL